MNFYVLVVEEFSGHEYPVSNTLSLSWDQINEKKNNFRHDLYKKVSIKSIHLLLEEVIGLIINNDQNLKSYLADIIFNDSVLQ